MTNEELATQIKAGKSELYAELWGQTEAFFRAEARQYYFAFQKVCRAAGVDTDDLTQCGFFALTKAVQAFKEESGYKLLTYAKLHLRNSYREATGKRGRKEPLNDASSLDVPVSEDADASLIDLLADLDSVQLYEDIDKNLTIRKLRKVLDEMIDELPEQQARVIRLHYFMGFTLERIAELIGKDKGYIFAVKEAALTGLYRDRQRLKIYKKELIPSRRKKEIPYQGVGLASFHNCWASSVELYADGIRAKKANPATDQNTDAGK